jgi:toxin ParE1/3/4
MTYWFHPEARTELLESIAYYEFQQKGLGRRFFDGTIEGLSRIRAHPQMYRIISGQWRQCRIPRFPFGLVYCVRNRRIEIIAVMHLNRKPGYWRERTV